MFTKLRVEEARKRIAAIDNGDLRDVHRWYKQDIPDLINHVAYLEQQFEAVVKKLHAKEGKNGRD